jgi:integrase/recombinase XerC
MPDLQHVPPAPTPAVAGPSPGSLYTDVLAGRSARTARAYRQDLEDFARFLKLPGPAEALAELVSWSQGTANHCAYQFRAHLAARGLAAATIARRLSALRSAVKLARAFGVCGWTLEVESPRRRAYRDTRGPGDEGWAAILAAAIAGAAEGARPIGRRDLAIVLLLHDLGLRRGEVAATDRADLDGRRMAIVGKGRSEREWLRLTTRAAAAIVAWEDDLGPGGTGPLFVSCDRGGGPKPGARLSGEGICDAVRRLGTAAGHRARPHGLRHQAITEALDKTGGDVRRVMKFSRHAKPETLLLYDDARRDDAGEIAELLAGGDGGAGG